MRCFQYLYKVQCDPDEFVKLQIEFNRVESKMFQREIEVEPLVTRIFENSLDKLNSYITTVLEKHNIGSRLRIEYYPETKRDIFYKLIQMFSDYKNNVIDLEEWESLLFDLFPLFDLSTDDEQFRKDITNQFIKFFEKELVPEFRSNHLISEFADIVKYYLDLIEEINYRRKLLFEFENSCLVDNWFRQNVKFISKTKSAPFDLEVFNKLIDDLVTILEIWFAKYLCNPNIEICPDTDKEVYRKFVEIFPIKKGKCITGSDFLEIKEVFEKLSRCEFRLADIFMYEVDF
jgi:hypothetical protein